TILIQQLTERIGRTLTIPVTASGVTSLQIPATPDAVLRWSSDGTMLIAQSLSSLGLSAALPSQAGKAGFVLGTDGNNPSWTNVPVSSVVGLTGAITGAGLKGALALTTADLSDFAAKQATAQGFALCMAAAL